MKQSAAGGFFWMEVEEEHRKLELFSWVGNRTPMTCLLEQASRGEVPNWKGQRWRWHLPTTRRESRRVQEKQDRRQRETKDAARLTDKFYSFIADVIMCRTHSWSTHTLRSEGFCWGEPGSCRFLQVLAVRPGVDLHAGRVSRSSVGSHLYTSLRVFLGGATRTHSLFW